MRHNGFLIVLHWLMLLLVIAAFALGSVREAVEDAELRVLLIDLHRTIGLTLLGLTIIRIAARLIVEPRFTPVRLSLPMRLAGSAAHGLLYGLMIAMPLVGWAQSSAKAHKFKLFGKVMPALIGYDPDKADLLAERHEQLAWLFLALIAFHSLAALYHHYVRRNEIMVAMFGRRVAGPSER